MCEKVVILGGMGPESTAVFLKIIKAAPSQRGVKKYAVCRSLCGCKGSNQIERQEIGY